MASKLEELRISRKLTRNQLSHISGVALQIITGIEHEIPLCVTVGNLRSIAAALNCKIHDLV